MRHSSSSVPTPCSQTSSGRPGNSSCRRRRTMPSPSLHGALPIGPTRASDGYGTDLPVAVDAGRRVVAEADEVARFPEVGDLARAAARQLEHTVAIGAHPDLPRELLERARDLLRLHGLTDLEDRRQVVDRRDRRAAAAQLAPRVALREQHALRAGRRRVSSRGCAATVRPCGTWTSTPPAR